MTTDVAAHRRTTIPEVASQHATKSQYENLFRDYVPRGIADSIGSERRIRRLPCGFPRSALSLAGRNFPRQTSGNPLKSIDNVRP